MPRMVTEEVERIMVSICWGLVFSVLRKRKKNISSDIFIIIIRLKFLKVIHFEKIYIDIQSSFFLITLGHFKHQHFKISKQNNVRIRNFHLNETK